MSTGEETKAVKVEFPPDIHCIVEKQKTLGTRNEYNAILSVILNIATTASCYDTAQFTTYLEVFRCPEDMVRKDCELKIRTPDIPSCDENGELTTANAEEPCFCYSTF